MWTNTCTVASTTFQDLNIFVVAHDHSVSDDWPFITIVWRTILAIAIPTATCVFIILVFMLAHMITSIALCELRIAKTIVVGVIATIVVRPLIHVKTILLPMTTMLVISALVRYAISVDYKAAVAVGVAIGLLPRISMELLACIVDILGHIIGTARAISLMVASIAVRTSIL